MKKYAFYLAIFLSACDKDNDAQIPVPPSNLTATAISSTEIKLEWKDNSPNENGFKLERKTAGGVFVPEASISSNVTSYTDEGLAPNTEYIYRVFPFNDEGNGTYSNEAGATTFPDLKSGLLLFLPFTGDASDSSGNNFHGVAIGPTMTKDRWGRDNKAYYFNGVSNYIMLPLMSSLNGITSYSLAFWVYSDYNFNQGIAGVFSHWISSSTPAGPIGLNLGIHGVTSDKSRSVDASMIGGLGSRGSANLLKDNVWTHVTVVFDGTKANLSERLALYINGEFQEYFGNANTPSALGNLANMSVVGASVGYVNGPLNVFFKGSLDELRIYNKKLSASEIMFLSDN
jgi:hypothetical protein